jgi:acetolactate synthase-1/2/3 large subunit
VNVSELIVKCLENEGVRHIFGLPGEENIAFLRSIRNSSINFITTRDERGASFMAAALGRLSSTPGVCVSSLGPGAINMIPGVADAFLDFSPLVAITAQKDLSESFKESHQYIDVLSTYRPVVKWGASIAGKNVPELVRKAFRVAGAEKPGPVHLELPEDVAEMETRGEPMPPARYQYPEPAPEAIGKAVQMLREAKEPILIAGNGVLRAGAHGQLYKFVKKLRIPAAATFMAMGAIPADEEMFLSTVGLQSRDYISCGLERADLIVTVGYDPVEFSPSYWKGKDSKPVLHISATPAEVDASYRSFELIGDIGKTLALLTRKITFKKEDPFLMNLKALSGRILAVNEKSYPLKPQAVIKAMREALGKSDILISDVGAHKIWIARFYPAYRPNTVLMSNGFASMGFAIPAAIAARLACPERKVLAAVGDGGLLMTAPELETAQRLGLSFAVLIFNDGGYGLIEWKERAKYGEKFFTDFGNPDFMLLAQAFGAKGYRVERPGELPGILNDALKQKGISIIDCPVDYNENLKLTKKLGSLICPT